MAARTPPKGRPTAGRRDRQVAQQTSRSRSTTRKFVWGVLALTLLGAVLVLGTGTGGNGIDAPGTNALVPVLAFSRWRLRPDPRS